MAYQALARKYRSRTFDEVIGQEPIATTLANAIKTGRIHHGYLFTGTRGTGKTSMARILAKSLNCLNSPGPTVTPCLKCDACIAIAEGQDIDVVEIDAASNTGVDNIRELRSNTAYRPARSRFKIYIIDEVHMLSTGAFNALLKTLEEPPEHVKFILATTEIQKVPATIQSRCQRFNFRNIGPDAIAARLEKIVAAEKAKADPAVLRRIARLANGSMRDALSILDQCLSVSPEKLTADVVDELLPPAQDEQVFELLNLAAAGDAPGVLTNAGAIFEHGRGLETFSNDMIEVARTLMHMRAGGADAASIDIPAGARDAYVELAQKFDLSQYVQMIAMLEELKRNVRFSGAGRALTDALLVRLARLNQWSSIEQLLSGTQPSAQSAAPARPQPPPPTAARAPAVASPPARIAAPPHPVEEKKKLQPVGSALNGATEQREISGGAARTEDARFAAAPRSNRGPLPESPPNAVPHAAPVRPAAAQPAVADISSADRARIMQDPTVQEVIRLFDGVLVHVERPAAAAEIDPTIPSADHGLISP